MKLSDKFSRDQVEFRVQRSGVSNGKPWAMVLVYLTSRAIMDRLDQCVGPLNWKVSHSKMEGGMECTISIWDKEKEQWISKSDGAQESDIEGFKGSMSGSLKRAAVLWNMGRYLYSLKGNMFVELMTNKSGQYQAQIKDKATGKTTYYTYNAPELEGLYDD